MSLITLPGLIDPHVHLRDPGETQKEDFYTGTCAALAGGYTTILDMPNNNVPITTELSLNEKIKIAKEKIVCDVGFYFGSLGDNVEEFKKLFFYSSSDPPAGGESRSLKENSSRQARTINNLVSFVFGLKLYLNQTTGNFLIDKKTLQKIFFAWAKIAALCTPSLHSAGVKKEIPILVHAEDKMLNVVIELTKKTKNKVHVCHISTAEDLKQIKNAKQQGLKITCGVTPHHLFLNEHDAKMLGPYGKMKPPLAAKEDVDFLWKNLKYIDVIESDHAPHTIEEKGSDNPPFGVPGLETTLPLLLTAVSKKRLTINDIVRLCYTNPARIFNIKTDPKTKIEVDLNSSFIINNSSLFTKCKWSPFAGWKVKGKIKRVFIRGKKVFENDKILVKPGFGKILVR